MKFCLKKKMRVDFTFLVLTDTVLATQKVTHRYPTILTPKPTPEGKTEIKHLVVYV